MIEPLLEEGMTFNCLAAALMVRLGLDGNRHKFITVMAGSDDDFIARLRSGLRILSVAERGRLVTLGAVRINGEVRVR